MKVPREYRELCALHACKLSKEKTDIIALKLQSLLHYS